MVCEVKDPLSRQKCGLGLSSSHLVHHITAMIYLKYCGHMAENKKTKQQQKTGKSGSGGEALWNLPESETQTEGL